MRIVLAAMVIASLVAPALAQQEHVRGYREQEPDKSQAQKAADKAAVEAYKRSLGSIPDQGPTDPWGGVRSNDGPKPAATRTVKSKGKGVQGNSAQSKTTETRPQ
jgi:hypothetical protein